MSDETTLDEFERSEAMEGPNGPDHREKGFLTLPYDWDISDVKEASTEGGLIDGDWIESADMDENGDIQLVQLGHIGEGQFKGQPDRFINEEFAEEENCTILSEGDLLISRMQAPILRSCLLPPFDRQSVMAVDIARLRLTKDWNKHFVMCLFNSRPIRAQGIAWASGTTRKRISRKNIEKIQIPKPSIHEQRKIASVLYNVDQAIQKTDEIIHQIKTIRKGVMQDLFSEGYDEQREFQQTQYGKIPKSWDVRPLREVSTRIGSGGTPRTEVNDYYGGDIPWVKTDDLNSSVIISTKDTITDKGLEESSAKLFPEGTVIFAMYGGALGQHGRLGIEAAMNQACCGIVTDEDIMDSYFLHQQLFHRKQQLVSLSAGTHQQNITKSLIENFDVIVPSLEEQRKIGTVLSSLEEQISKNESYSLELLNLKKGLMQDLLIGEVRTTDADIDIPDEILQYG